MSKSQQEKATKLIKEANAEKKRKISAVSSEAETPEKEVKDAGNEFWKMPMERRLRKSDFPVGVQNLVG